MLPGRPSPAPSSSPLLPHARHPVLFAPPPSLCPLPTDLEFKVVYVGSAESETTDQVLESVMVGPVPMGASKFVLEVGWLPSPVAAWQLT